ncbi:MAG: hypothetical protein U0821_24340 [Chloroflexota bacterium]
MSAGGLVLLIVIVGIIGIAGYLTMSQSDMASRFRRLIRMNLDKDADEQTGLPPRRNAMWGADPDRTNEAAEIEKYTGVIRKGEAFTIVSNDASYWGASGFDVEGLVIGVAECETADAGGNFQFRYCMIEATPGTPNTLIIEGDAPATSVAYLGKAYAPDEEIGGVRAGQVINQLVEERRVYRDSGANERPVDLPPYENATIIAARYDGSLSLLEYEPGKGYLPVSAANPQGARYADMTVRLDDSGWLVRLVEVGAYSFLLELEPIKLSELTVHHVA